MNTHSSSLSIVASMALLCIGSTVAFAAGGDGWVKCKDGLKVQSAVTCEQHGGVIIDEAKRIPIAASQDKSSAIDTRQGFSPNASSKSASVGKSKSPAPRKKSGSTRTSHPTARCRDGAQYYSTVRKDACAKHGGVKLWY